MIRRMVPLQEDAARSVTPLANTDGTARRTIKLKAKRPHLNSELLKQLLCR